MSEVITEDSGRNISFRCPTDLYPRMTAAKVATRLSFQRMLEDAMSKWLAEKGY